MEELEDFSIFNYVRYLSKSKRESLERYFELVNSIDISNFNDNVKDMASKIQETDSIEEIEDQGVMALADSDLVYELETQFENIISTESESKILRKFKDAFLSLLTISIDQIIKEKIPDTLKIKKLTLIKGTSSTYFLYNLNNEISDEMQILLDRMDIALSSLTSKRKTDNSRHLIWKGEGQSLERVSKELYRLKFTEKPTSFKNGITNKTQINWIGSVHTLAHLLYSLHNYLPKRQLIASDGTAFFKCAKSCFNCNDELQFQLNSNWSDLAYKVRSSAKKHQESRDSVASILKSIPK